MSEDKAPQPDQGPSPIGEISQEPSAFEAFLDANQKKLVIAGVVVILGLVGYVVWDGLKKMRSEAAAGAVSSASTVPEYDAAAKEYEDLNAGGTALINKAQLQWRNQQPQEAIATVEGFISKYPEHPALGDAQTQLGSYLQQSGDLEKAKSAFNAAVDAKSASSSWALLSLGDIALAAGDNDAAKSSYERVVEDFPFHLQVKGLATERLKLIGVAPPVEKAPEAPKPITPPSATSKPVKVPAFPGAAPEQPKPTAPPAVIVPPTTPAIPVDPMPETPAIPETPKVETPAEPAPPVGE